MLRNICVSLFLQADLDVCVACALLSICDLHQSSVGAAGWSRSVINLWFASGLCSTLFLIVLFFYWFWFSLYLIIKACAPGFFSVWVDVFILYCMDVCVQFCVVLLLLCLFHLVFPAVFFSVWVDVFSLDCMDVCVQFCVVLLLLCLFHLVFPDISNFLFYFI
jgi:hypothetical protein